MLFSELFTVFLDYFGFPRPIYIKMPGSKTKSSTGLDCNRRDIQEVFVDENSKSNYLMVFMIF